MTSASRSVKLGNSWVTKYNYHGIDLWIFGEGNFIIQTSFSKNNSGRPKRKILNKKELDEIKKMIDAHKLSSKYFRIKLNGTDFQKSVWKAISRIPKNKTISYKSLAEKIKKPRAVRAVANACGANPLPVFIPCHRITASDGIGGFSAGIKLKKKLLLLDHCRL